MTEDPKRTVKPDTEVTASTVGSRRFDRVAQELGFTSKEARPRRWIARIGALLRQMREHSVLKQDEMAKAAEVTQPYLSRLENGLVPKRGPTIDVLLRCAEAAQCDIEISVRSKKDKQLLATVSSADLDHRMPATVTKPTDSDPKPAPSNDVYLGTDSSGHAVYGRIMRAETDDRLPATSEFEDAFKSFQKAAHSKAGLGDSVALVRAAIAQAILDIESLHAMQSPLSKRWVQLHPWQDSPGEVARRLVSDLESALALAGEVGKSYGREPKEYVVFSNVHPARSHYTEVRRMHRVSGGESEGKSGSKGNKS